jgi:hypothetical protein
MGCGGKSLLSALFEPIAYPLAYASYHCNERLLQMTITYNIDHVNLTDPATMLLPRVDRTLMALLSTESNAGKELVSKYVLADGDPAYPAEITYRVAEQKRGSELTKRISITLSSWASKVDSVTGIEDRKPIVATISVNVPVEFTVEPGDIVGFMGSLYSLTMPNESPTYVPAEYWNKLMFGITQVVG